MILLRLALGIALIGILLWTGLLDVAVLAGALRHPWLLLGAAASLFGTLLVAALRWQLLLRVQHIRLPAVETLRVVLAGAFVNTFLPGAVGGDLLRSGYVLRAVRGQRSRGLLSILMDRILGLAGLLAISAVVVALRPSLIPAPIAYGIWAAFAALICAVLALHAVTRWVERRVPPSSKRWRAAVCRALRELDAAFSAFHRTPSALAAGLAASMLVSVLDVVGLLLVMRAMGIDALPWMQQAVACTLALIANNLPVTPGGLGIGEAAFAHVALILEPQSSGAPYATAFLAYRCITIVSTLPGAFIGVRLPAPPETVQVPAGGRRRAAHPATSGLGKKDRTGRGR